MKHLNKNNIYTNKNDKIKEIKSFLNSKIISTLIIINNKYDNIINEGKNNLSNLFEDFKINS
jgi:hypothetical protein